MADILISKFTTQIPRVGATPATPGFAESEGQDPIAPSGTPQVYTPVTIGSPANGLSIDGSQVLTIGLASTSATGALSSTDWNTFNNKLNLTSPITGYTQGVNTALADTDTILQAFGKVQGQINARISGTIASGQVAFGTGVNTVGGSANFSYNDSVSRITLTRSLAGAFSNSLYLVNNSSNNGTGVGIFLNPSSNTNQIGYIASANDGGGNIDLRFFTFSGSLGERWRISPTGSLTSIGSQVITTTSNGNLLLTPNGTGFVMIGSGTPTNLLDVNGTARIRTISNLGSAATSVLVPSATGVISSRMMSELAADMGAVTITGAQTITGLKTFNVNYPSIQLYSTASNQSAGILARTNNGSGSFVSFITFEPSAIQGLGGNGGFGSSSSIIIYGNASNPSGGATTIEFRPGGFNADQMVLSIASSGLTIQNGSNITFNTGTGTRIGTATNQKLAFWNKTPIIQPTNAIGAAAFVANTSGIANDTATYGGYTMGQIAQALINVGILA